MALVAYFLFGFKPIFHVMARCKTSCFGFKISTLCNHFTKFVGINIIVMVILLWLFCCDFLSVIFFS